MRMIGCVSPPTAGELRILGLDPVARRPGDPGPARRLPAAGQPRPRADRAGEPHHLRALLRHPARGWPRERAAELLEFVQLTERADSKVEPLSGGMKRRLTIARALVNEPDMVLLDEPTTGLDPQARHLVWERLFRLKQQGVTLVLTTHYMDEAEQLCDRLVVMDGGRIVAEGSPRALIERLLHPRGGRAALRRPRRRTVYVGQARRHRRAASRCCPTGSCSTSATATTRSPRCTGRGAHPDQRAGAPQHAGGRVPAPHRPDAGGLMAVDVARRPPPPWAGAWSVFEYHLVGYRRTWRGSVFSSFLLPLLTMLGFGVGVGAYVTGGVGGVPLPRLHGARPDRLDRDAGRDRRVHAGRCSATSSGRRSTTRRRPPRCGCGDILGGHLVFVVFRVLTSVAGVPRVIAAAFGAMHSSGGRVLTLPIAVLLGLAVAAPTVAYSGDDPHRQLPGAAVPLRRDPDVAVRRRVLPGRVAAGRAALAGLRSRRCGTASTCAARRRSASPPAWSAAGHVAYLLLWAVVGWLLARRRFRRSGWWSD